MVGIDEGRANFTYHAPPVISSTFPFSGPVADSTAIVIRGANLGLGTDPTCRLVQGGTTQDRPSERLPASAVAPAPASASGDQGPGSEDDYGDAGSGSGGDDEGSGDYGSGSGDEDSWNNLTLGRGRASLNCTVDTSWDEGEVRVLVVLDGHASQEAAIFTKYRDPVATDIAPASGYGTITSVVVSGIALSSGFMRFTTDGGGPVVEATAAFEDGAMHSVAPAVPGYSGLSVASTVEVSLNGVHYTRSSPPLRFLYIMGAPLDITPDQGAEDTGLYTPSGACAYTGVDEVAGIGLLNQMGPRLGPVAGGTNVTILGAYFMTLDDDALRRVFTLTQP